jgi:predicted aspartyl protease
MPDITNKNVHALTNVNGCIASSIITPVEITNIFNKNTLSTKGIWDTGATNSVVTKSTAEILKLTPISRAKVRGVHGDREVNVYYVNITLNNKNITIDTRVTECDELSADNSVGMLIGMNIITMGDFTVTNLGQTVMSFRVPSLQRIDFVSGIKNGKQLVSEKIPGRNDPCYCNSGKKYKNCHGKKH